MLNFAVFGYGYWGPNIARNIHQAGGVVKYIIDASPSQREIAHEKYPNCTVSDSFDEALNDSELDAVVIVLPVSFHYSIAKKSLLAGKHVLVEKPLADSSEHVSELISIAEEKGVTLMVDHTYLYSPAIDYLKKHFQNNKETLNNFDSVRINLGKFQRDINVAWDLAVHDLSILNYICDYRPTSVIATGCTHTSTGLEDVVYITLKYNEPFIAHISISWISPIKVRRIIISGEKTMALFDDIEEKKVKIFDSRFNENNGNVNCVSGDVFVPEISSQETLYIMMQDFIESIKTGKLPKSDSYTGLEVVRILEAIQISLNTGGREVFL